MWTQIGRLKLRIGIARSKSGGAVMTECPESLWNKCTSVNCQEWDGQLEVLNEETSGGSSSSSSVQVCRGINLQAAINGPIFFCKEMTERMHIYCWREYTAPRAAAAGFSQRRASRAASLLSFNVRSKSWHALPTLHSNLPDSQWRASCRQTLVLATGPGAQNVIWPFCSKSIKIQVHRSSAELQSASLLTRAPRVHPAALPDLPRQGPKAQGCLDPGVAWISRSCRKKKQWAGPDELKCTFPRQLILYPLFLNEDGRILKIGLSNLKLFYRFRRYSTLTKTVLLESQAKKARILWINTCIERVGLLKYW